MSFDTLLTLTVSLLAIAALVIQRLLLLRSPNSARMPQFDPSPIQIGYAEQEVRAAADGELQRESHSKELERIAQLSREQARDELINQMVSEAKAASQEAIAQEEARLKADQEDSAARILLEVMERTIPFAVPEGTAVGIALPTEEMKGRLIGRDGRNVRAFEQCAEVDLIIDQTPNSVTISSFNPIRREAARIALTALLKDGKVNPTRIEEAVAEAKSEVLRIANERAQEAVGMLGIVGLPPEVIRQMGVLHFKASLGQNLLAHSVETATFAANLACELRLDVELAKTAGFLHDIGKGLDEEAARPHALVGMNFLSGHCLGPSLLNAVGAHHREIEPETPEALVVIAADAMSAVRPGARSQALEPYIQRIAKLEAIAEAIPGVERAFAVQSGRELRVFVKPDVVDDSGANQIAQLLMDKIKADSPLPQTTTVIVIREYRAEVKTT